MVALVCARSHHFPNEVNALSHGELNFMYASYMLDSEISEKQAIELSNKRGNLGPPKKITLGKRK